MSANLDEIEQLLQKVQQSLHGSENSFSNHCIDRGGVIKDLLRKQGTNPYNNYDRRNYTRQAERMMSDEGAEEHLLDETTRTGLESQYRATAHPSLEEISFTIPNFQSLAEKISDLAWKTVLSQVIPSLRDDPETSAWVHTGLNIHKSKSSSNCLFCDQSLHPERLTSLERHFSDAYEEFISSLDAATLEIKEISDSLVSLNVPDSTQFYQHLFDDYRTVKANIDQYFSTAQANLQHLDTEIKNKRQHPFESIVVSKDKIAFADSSALDQLNSLIRNHNDTIKNHASTSSLAGQRLERGLVADGLEAYERMRTFVKTYEGIVASLNRRAEAIKSEISDLQVAMTEHHRPAEELNYDLRNYLGHNELQLEVQDNGYVLTRNSTPASEPSEGEITAIALLYFLKSLKDHRFDFDKGVVVLDDPISSLDENSLYLAFGFIQERTRSTGQLFVFTHNFGFFRQMKNWFHHLPNQGSSVLDRRTGRFFMLNCSVDGDGRYSSIQKLDPLLEMYESDYHYLFARIHAGATVSNSDLEGNYSLPNMARRLLEAFLAFRQPNVVGELRRKLQDVDFNEAKKAQILRFVHTNSHNDAIPEPEHDLSLLSETQPVLKSLLELIEEEDPEHYSRMLELVARKVKSAGE